MNLNIVLANPQIPQNTGNVARTCAATGAALHLIKPMGFALDDSKMKRAGLDYWEKLNVTVHDSFADFFAHTADMGTYWFFETKSAKNYCDVTYSDNAYLIFGREDTGIPDDILRAHYDTAVRIPMRAGLRSLNMSNSVAVGVYEVLRQWNFPQLLNYGNL
ncbi:MAG: tRNA (uridine(34)/cytosine(34)/5-carboxymethylaminomethyluridine(34)-2'-O)-methyltransferase TrmL [Oscillospiraceae bacterium]|nr:tRNA (uridine(34)/cytosine(34)/5-carboxymethylaminomethyluridine(34)-2'-O)-methyltransferase TrmL [Oscillospiraceae bacterium]